MSQRNPLRNRLYLTLNFLLVRFARNYLTIDQMCIFVERKEEKLRKQSKSSLFYVNQLDFFQTFANRMFDKN